VLYTLNNLVVCCRIECLSQTPSAVNGGMPVRDTDALVKLRLLMLMMLLIVRHSDARPFINCRLSTSADDERHLSVVATVNDCSTTQQSTETLSDVTVQQATQHRIPNEYNFVNMCHLIENFRKFND